LPSASRIAQTAAAERIAGAFRLRLRPAHGVALLALFILGCGLAQAQVQPGQPSILATLWKWTPVLLRGFVFNLVISAVAMAAGTIVGLFLGFAQISLLLPVRKGAWLTTHFFRNAPWLVLLFYCMFLLPFQVTIFGVTIPIPDWIKATLGLSLPVMANVSEIVRGAIQSIPTAQWESAASLAFNRRQTLWMIIFPQCIKRMLPPWMNLYAILTMATVLTSKKSAIPSLPARISIRRAGTRRASENAVGVVSTISWLSDTVTCTIARAMYGADPRVGFLTTSRFVNPAKPSASLRPRPPALSISNRNSVPPGSLTPV